MGEVAGPHHVLGADAVDDHADAVVVGLGRDDAVLLEQLGGRRAAPARAIRDGRRGGPTSTATIPCPTRGTRPAAPDGGRARRRARATPSPPSAPSDATARGGPAKPVNRSRADRRALQSESFVHRHRQPEIGARRPQRVVRGVTEVASVQVVRAHHHADELEIVCALRLCDGEVDVGERHEASRRHARRLVRAVLRDPVVVRTACGG